MPLPAIFEPSPDRKTREGAANIMSRKTVAVVLGTLLVAAPVLAYWAYVYAYEQQYLFLQYPWPSELGRSLRTIAAAGLALEAVGWFALGRYVRKRPAITA